MGRVDLDAIDRDLVAGYLVRQQAVADMVAELRVARQVIDPLVRRPCIFCGHGDHNLGCPLAAYDRHVQHLDDPGSERVGE